MVYYEYKKVRDLLIEHGYLDKYGCPAHIEEHGEELTTDYDGNIHSIAAKFIKNLIDENTKLHEVLQHERDLIGKHMAENHALAKEAETLRSIIEDRIVEESEEGNRMAASDAYFALVGEHLPEGGSLTDFISVANKERNNALLREQAFMQVCMDIQRKSLLSTADIEKRYIESDRLDALIDESSHCEQSKVFRISIETKAVERSLKNLQSYFSQGVPLADHEEIDIESEKIIMQWVDSTIDNAIYDLKAISRQSIKEEDK